MLATPVPREKGIAHFHDVRIWNIKASGATTAFEVDGYKEVPLDRFSLANLDIEAEKGGHIYDAKAWQFTDTKLRVKEPVAIEDAAAVRGLPSGTVVVKPAPPKEDPSKKSFEEQDKT